MISEYKVLMNLLKTKRLYYLIISMINTYKKKDVMNLSLSIYKN